VIFTSDNGGTARAVNMPLRGNKGSTLEGGMRVPTIAWWPGQIPAQSQIDAIAGMFDILPTLTALAGGKLPADRKIDGANIWPHLAGAPLSKPAHDTFYFYSGFTLHAVRHGDWKLHIVSPVKNSKKNEPMPQLYNLRSDIGESKNVATEHPEVVAQLQALVQSMKDDLGLDGPAPGSRELGNVDNPKPLLDFEK
jgi:arylsulfatase A